MVRPHSSPLHGLRTSRYRGGRAVRLLSDRLGISPNISPSVVKSLCHASPVFPRFRVNGSHPSHHGGGPPFGLVLPSSFLPPFFGFFNKLEGLLYSRYHGTWSALECATTRRKRLVRRWILTWMCVFPCCSKLITYISFTVLKMT